MHGRGRGRGDIEREQDEALAALLRPGAAGVTAGGTALRPGTGETSPHLSGINAARAPDFSAAPASPVWLPWAALAGGGAIGVGCILTGLQIAPLIARAVWPNGDVGAAWIDALFTLAIFVPMLLLAFVAAVTTGVRPLRAGRQPGAMLALGLAVGAGGVALAASYAGFAGVAHRGPSGAASLLVLAGSALMLLQSGTEEVLLRGWMQPAIESRWSPWTAVLLTALVFAGLHLLGGTRSPVSFVNLTIGGIMFGLLRWKSGGLLAPLAAHFGWNWTEAFLLGLDPNPGIGSFGAIFDLDMVGPAIWGGSDEGLNASLAMMVVLIAIVVPLALWRRRGA